MLVGIGALVAVQQRGDLDQVPADTSALRFAGPIPDDLVPIVDPAPFEAVAGSDSSFWNEWLSGIESADIFAVVDDDGSVREVAVMIDTAIPWAAVSDGVDIGNIGGVDAVVIENADEPGIFLRRGDVARGVFNAVFSDDGDTLVGVTDEVREIAALVGDREVGGFFQSDSVIRLPLLSPGSGAVNYGNDAQLQLIRTTVDAPPSAAEAQVLMDLVGHVVAPQPNESRVIEVLQLSPVDFLTIVAESQEQLADAVAGLDFVPRDESDIQFEQSWRHRPEVDQEAARGEAAWGRWELRTSSVDPGCWSFAVTIWGPTNEGDSGGACVDAGATDTVPTAFCLQLDDAVVGAALGPDAVIELNEGDLELQIERTAGATTFRVPNGSGFEPVTIDGQTLSCAT